MVDLFQGEQLSSIPHSRKAGMHGSYSDVSSFEESWAITHDVGTLPTATCLSHLSFAFQGLTLTES